MEFIEIYHIAGLVIGIVTFLIIGLFHPIVIKAEYHWGVRSWWIFLILGIVGAVISVMVDNILLSAAAGVFAFSSLWSIGEIFQQRKRVEKGWFPENPKRKNKK